MLQETSMLYKLTILYILHRTGFQMSNSQISNFLLENDFTDYFNLQQILGELIDDGYVARESLRNRTLYRISESGEAVLKLLNRDLSPAIKNDVDKYIKENKMMLKEELSCPARYDRTDYSTYITNLCIVENDAKIFEMNIEAGSEDEADRLCAAWQKGSSVIYPFVMKTLLGSTGNATSGATSGDGSCG